MGEFVTLADGCRLHWRLDGPQGAPVLLLSNSLGTNMDMWAPQMTALTRHFQVLRYDSRGHGLSDAPAGPYSIDLLGRDAVGLLDVLGIDKVRFAGLSKGGMVGQWLGAHAHERLSHLVLCNTAAEMAPPEPWNARIALVKAQGMGAVVNGVVERWFTEGFRTGNPDAIAPITAMLHATPVEGYTACCAAVRDMDQRASLLRIPVPTLVIGGRHDPATPIGKSHELARLIPGAKLVELEAAHLSNIEQAEAFTAALLSFLKD